MEPGDDNQKGRIKYEFINPNEGDVSAYLGRIFGRAVERLKQAETLENRGISLDFLTKK
jgi:hypothetical protein